MSKRNRIKTNPRRPRPQYAEGAPPNTKYYRLPDRAVVTREQPNADNPRGYIAQMNQVDTP